jgi:hypothetical protein
LLARVRYFVREHHDERDLRASGNHAELTEQSTENYRYLNREELHFRFRQLHDLASGDFRIDPEQNHQRSREQRRHRFQR